MNGYVQKVLNNAGVTVQGVSAQQAVKLKAAGEGKASPQGSGVNVYDTNTNDVMVY
ncbi:hypothetical protein MRX58_13215 (plasmid) [Xylella fastidiosa subsp. pauca]|uniref:hypothetical protein n=1 Tax=Xylella fastidiosa TaxID=2371 RepID=UPI00241EB69E|nr:hypothetical protein [Xylella fastidiosa]MDG5824457.1 hypothetical protein [Xylella fastidiosa subsp. pauca]